MMTRFLLTTLMMGSAFAVALPAYAQVTDQTDQSEEDWRKSRKKSGTTDIFETDTRSIGSGSPIVDYKPISPVERLSSESRRHLMKERAKAIAESEDGDISDAEYVPSEAAKSDEDLMREEKEAWDVIVTDMEGSGGSGQAGQGENKVAVAGVGGGSSTGPRGGSTRTLQEIMDAIKNGGVSSGAGQGQSDQGQSSDQAPSGTANGSGQSSEGEATQVADAGAATGGGSADGSGQGNAGASGGSQSGSGDQDGDAGDGGAQGDASHAGQTAEPLSPLDRMRKAREDRPATGTQRSASDYLGTGGDN